MTKNPLLPCPSSPNCVSTLDADAKHSMKPMPYLKARHESMEEILKIIHHMSRSQVLESSDAYIHASFKTAVFRFIDDVEFFFDDEARLVHFRSASRLGYHDLGKNRRRMNEICAKYLEEFDD